jgi:phage N-6-adenine-methyltransferase
MTFYCRMDAAGSLQECFSQCSDCGAAQPVLSDQERWQTPPEVWNPLHREFQFDLDAFADAQTKRLPRYLTDALGPEDWPGQRCFMNPPYGRKLDPCMRRGYEEAAKGKTVVAVIPLRGRGDWWHEVVIGKAKAVRPVRKRVKFIRPDGTRGEYTGSCDSVIVIWDGPGPHKTVMESFYQSFGDQSYD